MAKGLVRDAAGRYHSPDGRFAVEDEGTELVPAGHIADR